MYINIVYTTCNSSGLIYLQNERIILKLLIMNNCDVEISGVFYKKEGAIPLKRSFFQEELNYEIRNIYFGTKNKSFYFLRFGLIDINIIMVRIVNSGRGTP